MNADERTETALREIAQRLGRNAAEAIDVEATAQGVLERLKHERSRNLIWGVGPRWLRVAAVIALAVAGGFWVLNGGGGSEERGPMRPMVVVADLGDLSTSQLSELLATLDEALNVPVSLSADAEAGLEELTEEQLHTVIQSMEG